MTPFVVMTEQTHALYSDIPCPDLHWAYVPPTVQSFEDMIESARKINTLSLEMLARSIDPNRSRHNQYVKLLGTLHDFICHRCGTSFGDVSAWTTSRALVLDGMSGVNPMAMSLVAGDKPVKSQADWQMAQKLILDFVQKLCVDTRCWFILIGHQEREIDELTGGISITISTLGRKLAPQLPRLFDEVIHSIRREKQFNWSTVTPNMALKARLLPLDANLAPSFVQLVESWKRIGGVLETYTHGVVTP